MLAKEKFKIDEALQIMKKSELEKKCQFDLSIFLPNILLLFLFSMLNLKAIRLYVSMLNPKVVQIKQMFIYEQNISTRAILKLHLAQYFQVLP